MSEQPTTTDSVHAESEVRAALAGAPVDIGRDAVTAPLSQDTVLQCGMCHRQHDGGGNILAWRVVRALPENFITDCGRPDCSELVRQGLAQERVKRERRLAKRAARCDRQEAKKVLRHQTGDVRRVLAESEDDQRDVGSNHSFLARSEDDFTAEDEAAMRRTSNIEHRTPNAEFDQRDGASRTGDGLDNDQRQVAATKVSQQEFEASGAADNQNAILIELFSKAENLRQPIPMPYMCELSGGHHMNNRAIDLRRYFEPRGFGLLNEMRQAGPGGAMVSCYTLYPWDEYQAKKQAR